MPAPRTTIREQDLSQFARSAHSFGVGMVVDLKKGSIKRPIIPGDRDNFLDECTPKGTITVDMSLSHLGALQILKKTNMLHIARAVSKEARYGVLAFPDSNDAADDESTFSVDPENASLVKSPVLIHAENPGSWAKELSIANIGYRGVTTAISTTDGTVFTLEDSYPDGFPVFLSSDDLDDLTDEVLYIKNVDDGTQFLNSVGTPIDFEDATVMVTPASQYTRVPGTHALLIYKSGQLVRTIPYSITEGAKDLDGNNIYLPDALEMTYPDLAAVINPLATQSSLPEFIIPKPLVESSDGSPVTTGEYMKALELFANPREYPIKLIDDGGFTAIPYQRKILELAEKRDDSFGVLSTPIELQLNRKGAAARQANWLATVANYNTSYGTIASSHQQVYDEFNDRYVYLSSSIWVTCAILESQAKYEVWFPPAGSKRGVVASNDCLIRYRPEEEDLLYDNRINPIMFEEGQGIKVNGQRTLLAAPSMLNKTHVRLMLNYIKRPTVELCDQYKHDLHHPAVIDDLVIKLRAMYSNLKDLWAFEEFSIFPRVTPQDKVEGRVPIKIIICPYNSIDNIEVTLGITNALVSFDLAEQLIG